MKLYEDCPVEFAFQNCGTNWFAKLNGPKDQIELVFNGLYNLKAANGELTYITPEIATFWTKESQMRRFFFNKVYLALADENVTEDNAAKELANEFAHKKILELKKESVPNLIVCERILMNDYRISPELDSLQNC